MSTLFGGNPATDVMILKKLREKKREEEIFREKEVEKDDRKVEEIGATPLRKRKYKDYSHFDYREQEGANPKFFENNKLTRKAKRKWIDSFTEEERKQLKQLQREHWRGILDVYFNKSGRGHK